MEKELVEGDGRNEQGARARVELGGRPVQLESTIQGLDSLAYSSFLARRRPSKTFRAEGPARTISSVLSNFRLGLRRIAERGRLARMGEKGHARAPDAQDERDSLENEFRAEGSHLPDVEQAVSRCESWE